MPEELPESHTWFARKFLWLVRLLVRLVYLRYGAPLRISGAGRVPKRGPLLVISNHQSSADPPAVQVACRRTVHFLARRELLEMENIRNLLIWWRIIPISQSKPDKGALKAAVALLKQGKCVGIFPEGQLSDDGELLEILPGIGMIVRMTQCPCICVGIQDSRFVMPNESMEPRWSGKPIKLRWGSVQRFSESASNEEIQNWTRNELHRLTH